LGLLLESGTGGMAKYKRIRQRYPKAHGIDRIDAACVGGSGAKVVLDSKIPILTTTALGGGSRQMCHLDNHGFSRSKPKAVKRVSGFQTGDTVRVVIEEGKYRGVQVGGAVVRERGHF